MSRNPDVSLNPERSEDLCDDGKTRPVAQFFSATLTKCQVVNERNCETSGDQRKCDKAYGVTAISDQDEFWKEVGTNLQPFITFGQQCTAVPEDEERRDLFVGVKIFILGGVIKFLNAGIIDVVRFVNIVLISVVVFIQSVVKIIL